MARNARALHVTGFSLRYVDSSGAVAADGVWSRRRGGDVAVRRVRPPTRAGRRPRAVRPGRGRAGDRRASAAETIARRCGSPARSRCAAASTAWCWSTGAPRAPTGWPHWRVAPSLRYSGCCPAGPGASWWRCRRPRPGSTPHSVHASGQYQSIAAVTTSVDGSRARRSPSHVFVNPQVFLPLRPRGAQVVITHEATHVATHASHEPRADLAGRGVRRLRRPALAAPSRHHDRGPDHRAGPSQRHPPAPSRACRVRDRSRSPRGAVRERLAGLSPAGPGGRDGEPRRVLRGGGLRRRRGTGAASVLRIRPGRLRPAVADPPVTLAGVSERRWSLVTFLVATVAFVVVAALASSRGIRCRVVRRPPVHESDVFTPTQIARANAYSDPARHLGWASLAVSLLVTIVLGLTPIGRRLAARLHGWWWVRVLQAVVALAVVGQPGDPALRDRRSPPVARLRLEHRGVGSLDGRPAEGAGAVDRHLEPSARWC